MTCSTHFQAISLKSGDGTPLSLRIYEPATHARASIVIGSAMGVNQTYYAPFAQWLAEQGYLVTTFDYRGSGDSMPPDGKLRGYKADLNDWTRDYEAVIDAAKAALPDAPLYLMGHSLGAQLPGLLRNQDKIDGMLSIAAGSGYWRDNAPKLMRVALYFWCLVVPLTTKLCGYFPGGTIRKVGNLPSGVVLQWRRWCMDPLYSVGAEGEAARRSYAEVKFPVLAWAITDDELMTLRGTNTLIDLYANAPRKVECIAPADIQTKRIGHFGFFREQFRHRLWPRAIESLQALGGLARAA